MLFPSPRPSLDECMQVAAEALQADSGRIYLDANVLIHCYEMSAGASEDLLKTLERYGDRVGVPVWAARETWDFITKRSRRKPLASLADRIKNEFKSFRRETTRYIDDSALGGASKDDYQRELGEALDGVIDKINKVAQHEPKIDQTTDRLLPFIEAHRVPSQMRSIFDEVARTAPFRTLHRIPPGFGDAPLPTGEEADAEPERPKSKGKGVNPNGDLIIWFEVLEDCVRSNAEHLVIVTKDTQKGDLVYFPKKVRDGAGRLQDNRTGITLPQPLLVQEAMEVCPSLKSVSVISVEVLASIWTTQNFDVARLAAALQAEGEDAEQSRDGEETPAHGAPPGDQAYTAEFKSADLSFEPTDEDDIGRLLLDLGVDGWKSQNQAARRLEPMLGSLDRDQRIYVGRELAAATFAGAVGPAELFDRVLTNDAAPTPLRSDLLIGVLAQTYIDDGGEPKKPAAARAIAEALYRHRGKPELADAYAAVLARLHPLRREYLALPEDGEIKIPLDIALQGTRLINVTAADVPLLEEAAPAGRALQRSGNDAELTIKELLELLAKEFVVPVSALQADLPEDARITVPEHLGFVAWGPQTGNQLR